MIPSFPILSGLGVNAFLPLDLGGLVLDLDGNDTSGTGAVIANGTAIEAWVDKSGNNNGWTQSTSGSQPTVVTNQLNGLSVVNFNSQFMTNSSIGSLSAMTIVIIYNATDNNVGGSILSSSTSGQNFYIEKGGNPYPFQVSQAFGSTFDTTPYRIVLIRLPSTSSALVYFNSSSTTTFTGNPSIGTLIVHNLGQRFDSTYFLGNLARVLIYNKDLSNLWQRQLLISYLALTYGISAS